MINDLLLNVLDKKETKRTPVWMMRQAGRYLPDYMKLKAKYSFFERCKTPELATAITLQPIEQIGVDAAIIFSDILVVPQAMGMEVQMVEGKGPFLPQTIKSTSDLEKIFIPDVSETLGYVFDAIKLTKKELNESVPLIGFAGAPWTLLCYMVYGKGSKTFDEAKAFCYTQPHLARQLLDMITQTTISYLQGQVKAGADVLQIFDSWGGLLSPSDFQTWSLPYLKQITQALKDETRVILFAKGAWHSLSAMAETGAHALGIDWCIDPKMARELSGDNIVLQGNFDPAKLLAPVNEIRAEVKKMLKDFGRSNHIANLGHGILPNVPVDHAKAFVDAVKEFSINA
jgi:uroporphyrinogen decarboxylase